MVAALALILDAALGLAILVSVPGTGRMRRRSQVSKSTPPSPNVDA
jgi:hypothetical protein